MTSSPPSHRVPSPSYPLASGVERVGTRQLFLWNVYGIAEKARRGRQEVMRKTGGKRRDDERLRGGMMRRMGVKEYEEAETGGGGGRKN